MSECLANVIIATLSLVLAYRAWRELRRGAKRRPIDDLADAVEELRK